MDEETSATKIQSLARLYLAKKVVARNKKENLRIKRKFKEGKEGDRIEAQWNGGRVWYYGRIIEVNENKTYDVKYDDGAVDFCIQAESIRRIDESTGASRTVIEGSFDVASDTDSSITSCDSYPSSDFDFLGDSLGVNEEKASQDAIDNTAFHQEILECVETLEAADKTEKEKVDQDLVEISDLLSIQSHSHEGSSKMKEGKAHDIPQALARGYLERSSLLKHHVQDISATRIQRKYQVVGNAGALVRENPDLDSTEVGTIAQGDVVRVGDVEPAYTSHSLVLSGRRVRVVSPLCGYASVVGDNGSQILCPIGSKTKSELLLNASGAGKSESFKKRQRSLSPGIVRSPGAPRVTVTSPQKRKEGFAVGPSAVLETMLQAYTEVAEIIQQNEELEAKVAELTDQLKEQGKLNDDLKKMESDRLQYIESLEKEKAEMQTAIELLTSCNESLEKNLKKMEEDIQMKDACNESLIKENHDIQAEKQMLTACNESLQEELNKEQERQEKAQNDLLFALNALFENQERIQCIADEATYENIEKELDKAVLSIRKAKETHIRKSAAKHSGAWNSECVICWDGPKEVLVNPCKHFCVCLSCSKDIAKCPLCQTAIESVDRIYAS